MISSIANIFHKYTYHTLVLVIFILVLLASIKKCPPNVIALKLMVLPAYIMGIRGLRSMERRARATDKKRDIASYIATDASLFVGLLLLSLWDPNISVILLVSLFLIGIALKSLASYSSLGKLYQ